MEKVIHIYKRGEEPKSYEYWLTKSVEERIAALEFIRYQAYGNEIDKGLQRVIRIVDLKKYREK